MQFRKLNPFISIISCTYSDVKVMLIGRQKIKKTLQFSVVALQLSQKSILDDIVKDSSQRNPSKSRQRFVEAVVLISASNWSEGMSNFEDFSETPLEPDQSKVKQG